VDSELLLFLAMPLATVLFILWRDRERYSAKPLTSDRELQALDIRRDRKRAIRADLKDWEEQYTWAVIRATGNPVQLPDPGIREIPDRGMYFNSVNEMRKALHDKPLILPKGEYVEVTTFGDKEPKYMEVRR
jgi:hypothetical protein